MNDLCIVVTAQRHPTNSGSSLSLSTTEKRRRFNFITIACTQKLSADISLCCMSRKRSSCSTSSQSKRSRARKSGRKRLKWCSCYRHKSLNSPTRCPLYTCEKGTIARNSKSGLARNLQFKYSSWAHASVAAASDQSSTTSWALGQTNFASLLHRYQVTRATR